MNANQIEAILGSPPERDELVIQLFVRNGGQWAEIYREGDVYWIDLYGSGGVTPLRFRVDEVINALTRSVNELRKRLENT